MLGLNLAQSMISEVAYAMQTDLMAQHSPIQGAPTARGFLDIVEQRA
ncbi:MAG: hypothetical protein WBL23_05680 [Salinisphaera sp.]